MQYERHKWRSWQRALLDGEHEERHYDRLSHELPTAELDAGTEVVFTFRWAGKWEGKDFRVAIAA